MKLNPLEIKKKYWLDQYDKCLTSIAVLEQRLETLVTVESEKVVGEKEAGALGGSKAKIKVTAKEVIADTNNELEEKRNIQRALEKLLNQ